MSAWVTAGFVAPGVRAWFGRIAPALVTRTVPVLAGFGFGIGFGVWVGFGAGRVAGAAVEAVPGAASTGCEAAGPDDFVESEVLVDDVHALLSASETAIAAAVITRAGGRGVRAMSVVQSRGGAVGSL